MSESARVTITEEDDKSFVVIDKRTMKLHRINNLEELLAWLSGYFGNEEEEDDEDPPGELRTT